MKPLKTIPFLILSMLLFSNTTFAANQRPFDNNNGGPAGQQPRQQLELPDDWDDMTDEEKLEYLEENWSEDEMQGGRPEQGGKIQTELPDDWDDMTEDEQQEWIEENRPERGDGRQGRQPGGMMRLELPDDWEDMTDEEKLEYLEENQPETDGINTGQQTGANQSAQKKSYTKKARNGTNYKKFTGTLVSKKTFNDEDEIENQEAVQYLQQRGIINGYEDGSFGPKNPISRAESIKILLEALQLSTDEAEESSFPDVSEDDWYFKYIETAKKQGFIKGYTDGNFRPNQTVNQSELLKIAFESFGIDLTDYEVTDLPDGADADAWYAVYLQYALDNDLLDEDEIDLAEGMTREMFSEMIYRLIQQQESLSE